MYLLDILRRAVVPICLLALIAACTPQPPAPGAGETDIDPDGPISVALLVPTGSTDPQRAALGRALENAARLAEGDLQGVRLTLRVYDTGGTPDAGVEAMQSALDDGAQVVLGPLFSDVAVAVAPLAGAANVPVLSFSNNPVIAGGNLYVLGNTFENTARRVIGFSSAQGLTSVGIVHPQGVEGTQARAAVLDAAAAFGATVVASGSYPLSVEGISSTVPGIARDLRGLGANVVVLTDGPTGGLTFVAETLRGSGLRPDAVRLAGLQRWDTSLQALAQPGLEGGWFAAPDPVLAQQFANRFEARFAMAPHPLSALAYDGMAAIGALISEARAEARRDAFSRARLTAPTGFAGVGGVFRLRDTGAVERALAVFEVRDGAARLIDPAPRGFGVDGS